MTDILKVKIDEAMSKFKETGKEYEFNICSDGKEITTTQLGDGKMKNTCSPGMEIGSFKVHPGIKDVPPSPKDITDIQPDVPKV